jgi:hypothetical protein
MSAMESNRVGNTRPSQLAGALACRLVSKVMRATIAVMAVLSVAVGLVACGGDGGGAGNEVVAQVGATKITKSQLDRWMSTLLGGDFFELTEVTAPEHLVSEPPRIEACVASLKAFGIHLPQAQLTSSCRQLYLQVREQAVSYLVRAAVSDEENAELGIKVSSREIATAFAALRKADFPKESELRQYLLEHHWTVATELFVLKKDLNGTRRLQKVREKLGKKASEAAIASYYQTLGDKWLAKASCRPGYVAEGCEGYKEPKTDTVSPDTVIEEIMKAR